MERGVHIAAPVVALMLGLALGACDGAATWMAAADWRSEIAFLQHFEGLKRPLAVHRHYTNAHLPARAVAP